jgi:hypothetical protein
VSPINRTRIQAVTAASTGPGVVPRKVTQLTWSTERSSAEAPTLPQIEINGAHLHAEAFGDPTAPTVVVGPPSPWPPCARRPARRPEPRRPLDRALSSLDGLLLGS